MTAHKFISVEGAGVEAVNGVYQRVDTFHNAGKYSKIGLYKGRNQELSLYRFDVCWFISIVPMGKEPGVGTDIDFYSVDKACETDPRFPPSTGWTTESEGCDPSPFVSVEQVGATNTDVPTVSALKSVAETYQKMLFSEKFSDIKFICGDNVTVHAHRNILAVASPYFDTAFDGPWKENENGDWRTLHPSHIIKPVLTFLYTGKIDFGLVDKDPLAFISVASEYDLTGLKFLTDSYSVRLVNANNIKAMLQAAYLYNCPALKNACAEYVKMNSLTLLQNNEIQSLKTDNPQVWDELWKAIDLL
jgi:hypothetical protein